MPLTSDQIIDRKRLKSQISMWRALVALMVLAFIGLGTLDHYHGSKGIVMGRDFIARVNISGEIADDQKRDDLLADLRDNPHVKAVIVKLDTPGGTAVGGQEIYLRLREIAATKPVVATMRTLCASAGYMSALGADYVLARETTMTGSIGVLMQSVEVSELAKKLGVKPVTIKSGEFKDAPSMFRPINAREEEAIAAVVNDAFDYFKGLVAKRRNIPMDELNKIANGRVFTGRQALDLKLIDAIGGEEEALDWLHKQKHINPALEVHEVKPEPEFESLLEKLQQKAGFDIFSRVLLPLDGLVSIWHPPVNR